MKPKITLSEQAVKVIESIVSSGRDAKVSTGKDGIVIYEETKRKIHTEPQS